MNHMAVWILVSVVIGYPFWKMFMNRTDKYVQGDAAPKRKVKGPPPPDRKLPPLAGSFVQRKIARKL